MFEKKCDLYAVYKIIKRLIEISLVLVYQRYRKRYFDKNKIK